MLVLLETKHHVVVAARQELADCVAVHLVTHLNVIVLVNRVLDQLESR